METTFQIVPIGTVHMTTDRTWIEIHEPFKDGLLGLAGFSHINVFFWFHENDTDAGRSVLQVHPRKNPENPLTGVFATHSPMRPNLIGLTRCRVLGIEGTRIELETIDARDNTPVIDIKCYIPLDGGDSEVTLPEWV